MSEANVLLIGGTLNQTNAMLAVGEHLEGCNRFYTPFYLDGPLRWAARRGWLDFIPVGGHLRERCVCRLREAGVAIDERGEGRDYDLVVMCTDLFVPRNVRRKRIVLVQEGLTEPQGLMFRLVKHLGLPRYLANTASFGMSDAYEVFCVASLGYKDLFVGKGARPEKIVVTGIPNFDNPTVYLDNDFPHRDFVLVCTSNARETFKRDDRQRFIREALAIAAGRPVIFKLHPAEQHDRATEEILAIAPDAMVLRRGNTEHMIANCAALVAQYSTVAFTAAALGKEVHSYIDPEVLREILPIQNGGTSGRRIAEVCLDLLERGPAERSAATLEGASVSAPFSLGEIRLMPR